MGGVASEKYRLISSLPFAMSQDGLVYIWDRDTGNVLQTLPAHDGVAYSAVWNPLQSLLLSCGDDQVVRSWYFDESKPLFDDTIPSAVPP